VSTTSSKDPHAPLQWQKHQSAHFVFWFMPGSQAEKNVMALASRLEAVRDATVKALDLEDLPQEQLQIYLSDMPDGGRPEGRQGEGEVYKTGDGRILAVSLSDAPDRVLELALVELLLTSSLSIQADRSAMLVDGMLGYVAQQIGDSDPASLNAALARLQSEGPPITLADFLRGPTRKMKGLYYQVVTSFVTFLFTAYGAEPFKQFARQFDFEAPDRASEAAYGKPMAALEEEWLATLQQPQPSAPGRMQPPAVAGQAPPQAPGQMQGPEPGQMQPPQAAGQMQGPAPGIMALLRGAFPYLRPYWSQEVLIMLATVIAAAFTIVLPLAFGWVIDALRTQDYGSIIYIVLLVAVLFIISVPASLGKEYLGARVGANVMNDITFKMFEQLQRLSLDFYTRTRPGEIQSRFTNDLGLVGQALTQTLPLVATLVVTFVGSLITLFFLQGLLALLIVLVLPLFLILPARFGVQAARVTREVQQNRAVVNSTLQENLGAQQVVKAYSLQGLTLSRFRDQLNLLGRLAARGGFLSSLPGTTAQLSVTLIQVVALVGGAILVIYGALGVGALVSFQLLIGGVTGPMMSITGVWQMLLQASVGMQRVNELLHERPQIQDARDARALGRFSREIRFENVSFSYTGEQMNLRDVDLTIPAGQSVAFVGPSGSGKSTMLNLIMRFYDPTMGAVTIDGQDLRQVTQESLRSQIGAVFQDTFLYNATVRENITLGKLDATDEEVEAAAKAAEIHDFILTMPQGYDSPVGEGGGQLSGGQRQRIALARALLYDPAILVLDEPTSALDPETEAAVNATLHEQGQGRTVITVTHRLASVTDADRIFVLERGRVVEQGAHEELLNAQGLYHRLWGQQNGFEDAQQVGVEASRLRAIPLFENLDGALLSTLADRFVAERYAEGRVIFEEGDPGDKLYFIDRGEVEVVISGPAGEQRRVALLRDGDYFVEIALLEDVPRTATVRTRAPSVLLGLDREQFLELLQAVPDLRAAFEQGIEARRRANLAALREVVQAGGGR
ncbi:MAG TPA: ABC transporter transmembrane domain-containing protein, partial [Actinomycetota bacterium]|nr:ABC transporter transmembrane domain-containing protein [Actinomycetota bacterium]